MGGGSLAASPPVRPCGLFGFDPTLLSVMSECALKRIVFYMREEQKGGSRVGYWILFVLLILTAAYIYFRK